jgi:hypothetical protein
MNKRMVVGFVLAVLALGAAGSVLAGPNSDANMAIDAQAKNAKRSCLSLDTAYTSCSVINQVRAAGGYHDAIVVVYKFAGVTALVYGLQYPTTPDWFLTGYVNCADVPVIAPGGPGILKVGQGWSVCKVPPNPFPGDGGVGALWLQIYGTTPGRVDIIPHPDFAPGTTPTITDCAFFEELVCRYSHPGLFAGEVPGPGDHIPCDMGPTATEEQTWGGIKSLYR